ncbi:MAG: hypothetical protein K5Q68_14910 [Roseococcus sp.]|nr:hypothetical protein [Roseococcus sp.]
MIGFSSAMIGLGLFAILVLLIFAAMCAVARREGDAEKGLACLFLCPFPLAWIICWAVVRWPSA